MKLCDKLKEGTIMVPVKSINRYGAIQEMLDQLKKLGYLSGTVKLFTCIEELENSQSTAVGRGVAYPHSTSIEVDGLVTLLGISHKGVDYDAPDGQLCHFILLTLSPAKEPEEHRKFTSLFRKMISRPDVRTGILDAKNPAEIFEVIHTWEDFETTNEDID
jgi:mannitol/fructose-specific phosphotransferase system IIA component (Ntr-type)